MSEHCDFTEQATVGDGKRPDMVVKLPEGRLIAIDSKVPLAGYLKAVEAVDDAARDAGLREHVQAVRAHIKALASRDYAAELEGDVDLVVLFLPGDAFLAAAFGEDPDLQVEALRSRVLVATPTTLVALLRTVAIYHQQRVLADNAREIADTARELYDRAAKVGDDLAKAGRGLKTAVDAYNVAVGSFERRFLPMGQKLVDLKVTEQSRRELTAPEPLAVMPRIIGGDVDEASEDGRRQAVACRITRLEGKKRTRTRKRYPCPHDAENTPPFHSSSNAATTKSRSSEARPCSTASAAGARSVSSRPTRCRGRSSRSPSPPRPPRHRAPIASRGTSWRCRIRRPRRRSARPRRPRSASSTRADAPPRSGSRPSRPWGPIANKPFLETAPWLVAVFKEVHGVAEDGSKITNYYVNESVGIACGLFINSIHHMGLVTLTHTPQPMRFLNEILGRPKNERPFILFPVGYPADDCRVPDISKKSLEEITTWVE